MSTALKSTHRKSRVDNLPPPVKKFKANASTLTPLDAMHAHYQKKDARSYRALGVLTTERVKELAKLNKMPNRKAISSKNTAQYMENNPDMKHMLRSELKHVQAHRKASSSKPFGVKQSVYKAE
jgi:hypothetical protein